MLVSFDIVPITVCEYERLEKDAQNRAKSANAVTARIPRNCDNPGGDALAMASALVAESV
jgi:hypothetical protein